MDVRDCARWIPPIRSRRRSGRGRHGSLRQLAQTSDDRRNTSVLYHFLDNVLARRAPGRFRDLDERSNLPGFQSRRIVPINFLGRLDANIDIKNKLSTQKGDVSEDTDFGLLRFPRSFRHLVLMRGKGRQHFGLFSLRHREMIE